MPNCEIQYCICWWLSTAWLYSMCVCSSDKVRVSYMCKMVLEKLTHWGRDTMAAFSQATLSNTFSWMKMLEFRLRFNWSLILVPKGPINNIPALVQIMAWRRTGNKPLSEPMVTQSNDAYMRHSASMSLEVRVSLSMYFLVLIPYTRHPTCPQTSRHQ